ncbi:MAG: sulfotransferase family protein [Acidimicrobiales bacterium]
MNRPSSDLLRTRLSVDQKRRIAYTRMRFRRPLAWLRNTPDFMVIGAQRSGTSSLYRYLAAHPEGRPSLRKETEYFTRSYGEGPTWYRSHFTLRRRGVSFEATPDYLFHPLAPARVASDLPDCRLVVLLREPAARARSHWRHMTRIGFEHLSFADPLAAEPERTAADLARLEAGEPVVEGPLLRYSYRARGFYADQIDRWRAVFPTDQLLVLRSEDLFRDPAATLEQVERFVGLSHWVPPSFANWSAPSLEDDRGSDLGQHERCTLEQLREGYVAANRRLTELTGMPDWWT